MTKINFHIKGPTGGGPPENIFGQLNKLIKFIALKVMDEIDLFLLCMFINVIRT